MSEERVCYESGKKRIEVERFCGWYQWYRGENNDTEYFSGQPFEYHGVFVDLEECLLDATGECLDADDPDFTVSKDQRTPVRS